MKLLIVEDNQSLAQSIKHTLGDDFIVDLAFTTAEGHEKCQTATYDVIILDLQLPDGSGQDICTRLRKNGVTTPVLILSAESAISRRVSLLNDGADDFLMKPFHIAELQARLHALLRRSIIIGEASDLLRVGDLVLDISKRSVRRGNRIIQLRRKEFDILEYLVRNRGAKVTRAMLLNYAWEDEKESWDNTINVHIKRLRDKVDRPFAKPLIKTAYGIGYMIDDATVKRGKGATIT